MVRPRPVPEFALVVVAPGAQAAVRKARQRVAGSRGDRCDAGKAAHGDRLRAAGVGAARVRSGVVAVPQLAGAVQAPVHERAVRTERNALAVDQRGGDSHDARDPAHRDRLLAAPEGAAGIGTGVVPVPELAILVIAPRHDRAVREEGEVVKPTGRYGHDVRQPAHRNRTRAAWGAGAAVGARVVAVPELTVGVVAPGHYGPI